MRSNLKRSRPEGTSHLDLLETLFNLRFRPFLYASVSLVVRFGNSEYESIVILRLVHDPFSTPNSQFPILFLKIVWSLKYSIPLKRIQFDPDASQSFFPIQNKWNIPSFLILTSLVSITYKGERGSKTPEICMNYGWSHSHWKQH